MVSDANHKQPENNLIGVFGGTFDPIHYGHLRLAQELYHSIELTQVRFIPTGIPPHRDHPATTADMRLEMVRLAVQNNPAFMVDEREILRESPCYTFDTLTELREQYGPSYTLCLLLGADAFLGFAKWHRWQEIFDLAHIVVGQRPGYSITDWQSNMPEPLHKELKSRLIQVSQLSAAPIGRIAVEPISALDISATNIRRDLKMGLSPRYLLPDTVLDYIETHHLYT